ncbi:hypothetical protein RRG08_048193 [Elysia crispata]|uniref:Uncharacterized protein n=1 Tax=Elysia crispata TaxID=231223 RepID=A0AAE0ZVT9_9GAST|nr:hypothetical protein RRG08_048193 [Elysia crispata]
MKNSERDARKAAYIFLAAPAALKTFNNEGFPGVPRPSATLATRTGSTIRPEPTKEVLEAKSVYLNSGT